jgi:hypothetical protein
MEEPNDSVNTPTHSTELTDFFYNTVNPALNGTKNGKSGNLSLAEMLRVPWVWNPRIHIKSTCRKMNLPVKEGIFLFFAVPLYVGLTRVCEIN